MCLRAKPKAKARLRPRLPLRRKYAGIGKKAAATEAKVASSLTPMAKPLWLLEELLMGKFPTEKTTSTTTTSKKKRKKSTQKAEKNMTLKERRVIGMLTILTQQ